MNQKKAVILLSGGLDPATVAVMAKADGYACCTMSFNYGQRYRAEPQAIEHAVRQLDAIEYKAIGLDFNGMGGSALTDESIVVPESPSEGIPATYVLACNTVFPPLVLGQAEVPDVRDILIGVNAVDYSGHPNCRPEFVEASERVVDLATKAGVEDNGFRIQAPLQHLSKAQVIQADVVCGVDYGLMVSCYQVDEQGRACDKCDSYRLCADGLAAADTPDPAPYF